MADKAILEIDVAGDAFTAFTSKFGDFTQALRDLPRLWKDSTDAIDQLVGRMDPLTRQVRSLNRMFSNLHGTVHDLHQVSVELNQATGAGGQLNTTLRESAGLMRQTASSTGSITRDMARWPALFGHLKSVAGIFGIGVSIAGGRALINSIIETNRQATGAGMRWDQLRAIQTAGIGTLDSPAAYANALGRARYDITSAARLPFQVLYGNQAQAMLSSGPGGTTDPTAGMKMLEKFYQRYGNVPDWQLLPMARSIGVTRAGFTEEDIIRLRNDPGARTRFMEEAKKRAEIPKDTLDSLIKLEQTIRDLTTTLESKIAGPLSSLTEWLKNLTGENGIPGVIDAAGKLVAAMVAYKTLLGGGPLPTLFGRGGALAGAGAAGAGAGAGTEIALTIGAMVSATGAITALGIAAGEAGDKLQYLLPKRLRPPSKGGTGPELANPAGGPNLPMNYEGPEIETHPLSQPSLVDILSGKGKPTVPYAPRGPAVTGAPGYGPSGPPVTGAPGFAGPRFQSGTERVTESGLALIHKGEAIVPSAAGVGALGSAGLGSPEIRENAISTDKLTKTNTQLTQAVRELVRYLDALTKDSKKADTGGGVTRAATALASGMAAGVSGLGQAVQRAGLGGGVIGGGPGGGVIGGGRGGGFLGGGGGALRTDFGKPLNQSKQKSAQDVADVFRKAGASEAGIAGMFANIQSESAWRGGATEKGGTGVGLWQFSGTTAGSEKGRFLAWARQSGKNWQDPKAQAEYQVQNLKTKYPQVWEAMTSGKMSKEQVAEMFLTKYEIPKGTVHGQAQYGYSLQRAQQYRGGIPGVEHYTGGKGSTPTPKGNVGSEDADKPAKGAHETAAQGPWPEGVPRWWEKGDAKTKTGAVKSDADRFADRFMGQIGERAGGSPGGADKTKGTTPDVPLPPSRPKDFGVAPIPPSRPAGLGSPGTMAALQAAAPQACPPGAGGMPGGGMPGMLGGPGGLFGMLLSALKPKPLDPNNWSGSNRQVAYTIRNAPGANIYMTSAGMGSATA